MSKGNQDFSKNSLGSAHGKAADFNAKNLGSSTQGEHDFGSKASGELSKVASVADGKGKPDSMGKATGSAPPAATASMDKLRQVADGK